MNITLPRAVIEQALEALEYMDVTAEHCVDNRIPETAIKALRTALAQPEEYRCQWVEKGQGHCERNKRIGWTEQPEPEPVWWMLKTGHGTEFKEKLTDELKALTWNGKPMWVPLYTSPAQQPEPVREVWCGCGDSIMPDSGARCGNCLAAEASLPLSDDEIQAIWKKTFESGSSPNTFARAIEAAHGIKGEA